MDHVWPAEAGLWRPDLCLRRAAGGPAKRAEVLADESADIVVLSRDSAASVPARHRFRTLVIDESHGFKTPGSNRFRHARRITKTTDFVWELTGTPTPASLLDLWSQVFLLDRGERLGTSMGRYKERYFKPGFVIPSTGVVATWELRPGAQKRIHRLVSDICLHMKASDYLPDLPPITRNRVTVPLEAKQVYADLRQDLVADLGLLGGEIHTAANAAVLSSKLSQVSAGFLYSDRGDGSYTILHKAKVKALREIIEETGSPVLVFYRFKAEAEMIQSAIPEARLLDDAGVDLWNARKIPVLLAQPTSAGVGLNLQHGGHTIVWTTLPWSPAEFDQANARLARSGQNEPVIVHTLHSPDTVDDAIVATLDHKTTVQQALLEHLRK